MPRFSNWARTHTCTPREIVFPANEDDLAGLMLRARAQGRRIRVVGAAHSWSDIAMTDDILVSLDALGSVLSIDEARGLARVQAGIRLHALNDQLAVHGQALTILGSVAVQSIAGVLATGTHGSSQRHGNLASFVTGLRMVTGAGEVLELGEDDPRFAALRVGLGLGGIVTEVEIRVEPAFNLEEHAYRLPFEDALTRLDALLNAHEYLKLWWFPHTGSIQVYAYDRCPGPVPSGSLARWLDEKVVNGMLFPAILDLSRRVPDATPRINRLVASVLFREARRRGRSDRMFTLAMPPRHRETEWALPRRHTAEALRGMRALIRDEGARVNFIQEIRFVRGDDAWMSPAHGRDTCHIGAFIGSSPDAETYLAGTQAIFRELEGRPHWGKEFDTNPEEIRRLFPRATEFAALVRELDPDRVLTNAFTERVLGP